MAKGIRGFQVGQPKVPGSGRKRGTPNKSTVQVREMMGRIFCDPIYQANLLNRARMGELPSGVEQALAHYYGGKPVTQADLAQVQASEEAGERGALILLTRRPIGPTDPLAHMVSAGAGRSAALEAADRSEVEEADNRAALAVVQQSIAMPEEPIDPMLEELEELPAIPEATPPGGPYA